MSTKAKIFLLGGVALIATIILSRRLTEERGRAERAAGLQSEPWLDALDGPDLERKTQRIIQNSNYRCDHVRSTEKKQYAIVEIDCGIDGIYSVSEPTRGSYRISKH